MVAISLRESQRTYFAERKATFTVLQRFRAETIPPCRRLPSGHGPGPRPRRQTTSSPRAAGTISYSLGQRGKNVASDRLPQRCEEQVLAGQRHSPADNNHLGRKQRNHLRDRPTVDLRRPAEDRSGCLVAAGRRFGAPFWRSTARLHRHAAAGSRRPARRRRGRPWQWPSRWKRARRFRARLRPAGRAGGARSRRRCPQGQT